MMVRYSSLAGFKLVLVPLPAPLPHAHIQFGHCYCGNVEALLGSD